MRVAVVVVVGMAMAVVVEMPVEVGVGVGVGVRPLLCGTRGIGMRLQWRTHGEGLLAVATATGCSA